MKRKVLFVSALLLSMGSVFAQGEMDAYKLSQKDLTGTARSVSMGGAMGALGGDISAISINPAGIGVYKSSEIVTTLNFQNTNTKIESGFGKFDESKFKVNFDNLAFVATFPIASDVAPLINFGFSYNRLKNFHRQYSMEVANPDATLTDYMTYRANGVALKNDDPNELLFDDDDDIYPLQNYDWLAVLGANAGFFGYDDKGFFTIGGIPKGADNYLYVREKGSVDSYDFNVGTTFSDIVSAGLTLSITDLKYRLYSELSEAYASNNYTLFNELETDGSGIQVGLGVIVKPIHQLRLGMAYHSPTWYNMTDYYSAAYSPKMTGIIPAPTGNTIIETGRFQSEDYRLRTPDRWTFSLAGILLDPGEGLFPKLTVSADYVLTNYKNMKLHDDDGNAYVGANSDIENHFRMASTLRAGLEMRFTNQFSGRVGYSWQQSPMTKEFQDNQQEVMTVGSVTHFTLDKDTHYFTYGLGYRFTRSLYADLAFVMRQQKADIYVYDDSSKASWKDNTFQGLLTLGYKF
ncbi:OmpP1/FadL family transporter [Dysgonomonas sp. 511]|uniref:OmpP1/FadL family transporter n=1 Tax=Dysgonomonas sp. 511 TaxID=2302930 RepID=UPI0013D654D4|nr:outer membrane protein transport protein [Dysgonomonas sp. 511]NDV79551.1 hypothetical protein [Dysgonomonas sp. 511]